MKVVHFLLAIALVVVTVPFTLALAKPDDLVLRWQDGDGTVIKELTLQRSEVEALPQVEVVTRTPWTIGEQTFSGPSLGSLAALGSASVSEAHLTALNDYHASLPAEDWEKLGAILAVRRNGSLMEIKDKGPYWVIYPISADPKLDIQFYHGRMVWQVSSIDFTTK